MFFNTPEFVFLFLPTAFGGFFLILRTAGRTAALCWLIACSWLFYWSLDGANVLVLIASAGVNYTISRVVIAYAGRTGRPADGWTSIGIAINILLFLSLKFLAPWWPVASGGIAAAGGFAIPLGLSFFTVQQVAYQISNYNDAAPRGPTALQYLLFVSFFPYVVAGPMVRREEVLHQFEEVSPDR